MVWSSELADKANQTDSTNIGISTIVINIFIVNLKNASKFCWTNIKGIKNRLIKWNTNILIKIITYLNNPITISPKIGVSWSKLSAIFWANQSPKTPPATVPTVAPTIVPKAPENSDKIPPPAAAPLPPPSAAPIFPEFSLITWKTVPAPGTNRYGIELKRVCKNSSSPPSLQKSV